MAEKLAIMRNVTYGVDDRDRASLMFETYVNDTSAASHWIQQPEADQIIKDAGVNDVHLLEGQPCYVDQGVGTMKFLRVAQI